MQATSIEAFEKKKPEIPTDENMILSVLDKEKSLTYREIAKQIRVDYQLKGNNLIAMEWANPVRVARRMSKLVESDRAMIKEKRECSIAGSNCMAYVRA